MKGIIITEVAVAALIGSLVALGVYKTYDYLTKPEEVRLGEKKA